MWNIFLATASTISRRVRRAAVVVVNGLAARSDRNKTSPCPAVSHPDTVDSADGVIHLVQIVGNRALDSLKLGGRATLAPFAIFASRINLPVDVIKSSRVLLALVVGNELDVCGDSNGDRSEHICDANAHAGTSGVSSADFHDPLDQSAVVKSPGVVLIVAQLLTLFLPKNW